LHIHRIDTEMTCRTIANYVLYGFGHWNKNWSYLTHCMQWAYI